MQDATLVTEVCILLKQLSDVLGTAARIRLTVSLVKWSYDVLSFASERGKLISSFVIKIQL